MKLTEAQLLTLAMAIRMGFCNCAESYRPAQKLVSLGLAEWHKSKSGLSLPKLIPTPAGRRALQQKETQP